MFENQDDILTVEELCAVLKVGQSAAYRLLNSGEIKAFRNGRVWRIPKNNIVEYTNRKTKQLC